MTEQEMKTLERKVMARLRAEDRVKVIVAAGLCAFGMILFMAVIYLRFFH